MEGAENKKLLQSKRLMIDTQGNWKRREYNIEKGVRKDMNKNTNTQKK